MEEIFTLIENKKDEFAKLALFRFMSDTSISIEERLAWIPCLTWIAMSFADVWKYDFRDENSNDTIQLLINRHTYEDEDHWIWFIEDLKKLGFDKTLYFSDALKQLWGEKTKKTRLVTHHIAAEVKNVDPIVKIAAIEAIEATFHVFVSSTIPLTQEIKQTTNYTYRYLGGLHFDVEKSHTIREAEIKQLFNNIQLSSEQRAKSLAIVARVFELFSDSMDELLTYAKTHGNQKKLIAA